MRWRTWPPPSCFRSRDPVVWNSESPQPEADCVFEWSGCWVRQLPGKSNPSALRHFACRTAADIRSCSHNGACCRHGQMEYDGGWLRSLSKTRRAVSQIPHEELGDWHRRLLWTPPSFGYLHRGLEGTCADRARRTNDQGRGRSPKIPKPACHSSAL